MRSDVPIGTSLSGGLDSSSVLAITHELRSGSDSHKCFTAIFPGFEKDEFEFANKMANQYKLEHYTISLSENDLVNDLEKVLYHQEEPFGSSGIFAQYKVYGIAKEHHVTVLLDGQGLMKHWQVITNTINGIGRSFSGKEN